MTLHTPAGFDAFVRDVSDAAVAAGGPLGRGALVAGPPSPESTSSAPA
jgi:hypothetical protein